jgi:hypothetical protein
VSNVFGGVNEPLGTSLLCLRKRDAFFHGFFRVFGLATNPVSVPDRSPIEALEEDFFVVSNDARRVFERETTGSFIEKELVEDGQSE